MSKGEKLSAKEQLKRPTSIERERVMDKERYVKRQAKDIVEVDRVILHLSSHMKKIDMGGHTQPEPTSSIVKNFDDQTPVKLTRKDVEERAKMVVNALIISSDFNLGSPPEEVPVHGLYIIVTETEEEWMPRSLFDQPEQCVNFFQTLKKDGLLAQTIFTAVGSWYVIGVNISNSNHMCTYILCLYHYILYNIIFLFYFVYANIFYTYESL